VSELLLRAHLDPSAVLYVVYGCFVIWGFAVWLEVSRSESGVRPMPATAEAAATVPVPATVEVAR
jgi:nicotinamide mononucleotide transporter